MAILIKQELILVIVGGVFVIEALSVVIQVASFKMTGQRVFRMAPIHHHFELVGWSEPKVITRFVILAVVFALVGLSDPEAALMEFSVAGKRVTVAGAARSGRAAAELLARRGAHVTLSDISADVAGVESLRAAAACGSNWAGTNCRRSPARPDHCRARACRRICRSSLPRAGRACLSSARWSSRRAGCADASSPLPARRASPRRPS